MKNLINAKFGVAFLLKVLIFQTKYRIILTEVLKWRWYNNKYKIQLDENNWNNMCIMCIYIHRLYDQKTRW